MKPQSDARNTVESLLTQQVDLLKRIETHTNLVSRFIFWAYIVPALVLVTFWVAKWLAASACIDTPGISQ